MVIIKAAYLDIAVYCSKIAVYEKDPRKYVVQQNPHMPPIPTVGYCLYALYHAGGRGGAVASFASDRDRCLY